VGRKSRAKRRRRALATGLPPPETRSPPPLDWPSGALVNFGVLAAVSVLQFREVFLHRDQMLQGSDIVRLHSTFKAVQVRSFWEHGQFPLWDTTMLCGRSIVGDPLHALLSPLGWCFWVFTSPMLFGATLWLYATLGAFGVWLWMRQLGAGAIGGVVAAMAFAFSGKSAGYVFAGHMETLPTMLAAPWLFFAAERIVARRTLGSAVVLGGVLCVMATLGHLPTLYWSVLAMGAYMTAQSLVASRREPWGRALGMLGLGALGAIVFLVGGMAAWLPVVRQTLLLSARTAGTGVDFDFATVLSARPSDLWRLLWPFDGRPLPIPFASDPDNGFFWETASYPGLLSLALAGYLVVAASRDRRTVLLGLFALGTVVLALGRHTPVYRVVHDLVPGVALLRVPGRLFFLSNLFLAAMAGLGMDALLQRRDRMRWVFLAITAALLALASTGSARVDAADLHPAGGKTLSVVVLLALLLVAGMFVLGRIGRRAVAPLLLGVCLLDLGVVWSAHVHTARPEELIPSNSVAAFLQARRAERPFRYFDPTETVPQQLAARLGLESLTGYHPGIYGHQLESYRALWDSRDRSNVTQLLMHSPRDIVCTPALDVANVGYVVAYESALDDRFLRVFTTPEGEFERPISVFERKDPLPRAWIVPKSVVIEPGKATLKALCELAPQETCLTETDALNGSAAYQALEPTAQRPGNLELTFETEAPGALVVSEGWHPDWVATDRGESVSVVRANHGFIGIPLQPGAHNVRLSYWPWDFYLGCAVSGVFWLGLGACIVLARRKRAAVI
jgi:hypothetical protein